MGSPQGCTARNRLSFSILAKTKMHVEQKSRYIKIPNTEASYSKEKALCVSVWRLYSDQKDVQK